MSLEVDQLLNEINRSMTTIEFNKQKLLNGTFSSIRGVPIGAATNASWIGSMTFHIGANAGQYFGVTISTMSVRSFERGDFSFK